MKKNLALAITLMIACGLAAGQKSNSATRSPEATSAPQGLDEQIRAYRNALTKKDMAALDSIWAPDYTFINPRGELVDKAQRLANIRSGATEFQAIQSQRERLHTHGNIAVDIGRVTLHGTKYSGQESSGEYRYMTVWVKLENRWQLLANQITLIQK